jgi:ectoine hydroxylase-related dioxygenase (phytanoyl-CoA dioxygenase family)
MHGGDAPLLWRRVSPEGTRGWWRDKKAAGPRALTALDRYSFDLRGYLLFERVLDDATVARLRAMIDQQGLPAADETIARQRFGQDGQMFRWDRAFCDLIDHPLALAAVMELIGPYMRLDHAYGITMSPGTSGLGLHGPAEPFDASQYYVHRMGAMRSGLLTLTWSLTDTKPGDGGFGCIPGSHKASEPLPAGAESLLVEVPQPAGSLLVFTEALMHCTVPWRGPETRWALLFKYSPGSTAWGPTPAAPTDVVATMTPRQQRFFQPPSVGGRIPTVTP